MLFKCRIRNYTLSEFILRRMKSTSPALCCGRRPKVNRDLFEPLREAGKAMQRSETTGLATTPRLPPAVVRIALRSTLSAQ